MLNYRFRDFVSVLTLSFVALTHSLEAQEYGLSEGLKSRAVVTGLCNPSSVTFSPDGRLTVCDSGNGRVLVVKDGKAETLVDGFETEYWKVDAETGTKRFLLGPLSSVWVNDSTIAIANSGAKDGAETVMFFDGAGKAADGKPTNAVSPTSDDAADKGEGNLCGFSLSEDGKTIYVAGQGADAKSWVLAVDVESKKLTPVFSADEQGIEINSPMATMPWGSDSVLALYSGAGGKEDGLIVQWDVRSKKAVRQWTLPGLADPMGMARVPNSDSIVVVDNHWALTEVLPKGKLAHVALPKAGGPAKVEVLANELLGPVSCAFGPNGDLYIAQLGEAFDGDKGEVIAVSGIKP
ncbi:hypothetical protein [Roseiconus lacunae]|uniref:SMP-30/Gluconolactonase/LRE-like region domain-containing protein n=1 Tax=Roseiconus lacunae TaxID=2605694 RepID=A0ABT7PRX0_9BACT|nr:hypothetical protein [Roseiconus lacunae]MDM4019259.1 hypothetical protein [Roseiconus lacunae]